MSKYTLVYISCSGLVRSLDDFQEFTCYRSRSKLLESGWMAGDPEGDSGRSEGQQCDSVLSGGQQCVLKALAVWLRSTSPPYGQNPVYSKPDHVVQKLCLLAVTVARY